MTWISLICLLVLTSSAFGGPAYGGGYGGVSMQQAPKVLPTMRDQTIAQPFVPSFPIATQTYGQQPLISQWNSPVVQQQQDISAIQQPVLSNYGSSVLTSKTLPGPSYGQSFGAMPFIPQSDQQQQQQQPLAPAPTEADIICQGQVAETVIPLGNGHVFVVCLDDGKGVEQHCPKGLVYHLTSKRCERKSGPLPDPCALQPCLNGGQCVPTDYSYQCQCVAGFDGKICELDARVCQTQQPCGQSPDSNCQSFRLNAALQYICIFQNGLAYGLNSQQVIPSPCQGVDGPQALAVSNDGFIMCDGDQLFVESCPGGTIWDDVEKACTWPNNQIAAQFDQQQKTLSQSTYGNQMIPTQQYQQPKTVQSYGYQVNIPQQSKTISSYGAQMNIPQQQNIQSMDIPQQIQQPKTIQSYNVQKTVPHQLKKSKLIHSHHAQMIIPKQAPAYGSQVLPQQGSSYGSQVLPQQSGQFQSFQPTDQQQQPDDDTGSATQSSDY